MLFFFNYKCTWRFRHVFSYITCLLRVKNLLTQWGASLKQSQRDNEELREMGNREWCSKPVRELSHLWFSIWWLLCRPFHVRSDWYIRTSKVLWKEHQSTDVVAKFASSKGLRMLSLLVDDVIYLRTLYWASYRKSDKYIISYELAYPRLRDAYVGMVFNLAQTIRFVSEPGIRNFRPTIVSSNLIRYASGIIFEKSNSRIYVLKILFQSFNWF